MVLIFHDELISSQELHPLLANPPYKLTLTVSELTTPKNPKEKQSGNSGAADSDEEECTIPRPHNAFIIFRNDYAAKIKNSSEQKISIRLISQMASRQWKRESEMVKLFFKLLADMYQHRHRILYPDYKYSPKSNVSKKSKKRKMSKAKAKREESKGKRKGRIITWYIHDAVDKNIESTSTSDAFRYTDLNICDSEDLKIRNCFQQKTYNNSQPATFINYTASSTTPLILHSTTTTSASPAPPAPPAPPATLPPSYINGEDSLYITSGNTSSHYGEVASSHSLIPLDPPATSPPGSSPPDECLFWAGISNDNERDVPLSPFESPFEFSFDFDDGQLFEL